MTENVSSVKPALRTNYGNSDKIRKEESSSNDRKPVKKIIGSDSKVIKRNKPLGRKISETFTGEHARGIIAFVVSDVLIPQAKDMVNDAFGSALQRALYGETGGRRVGGNGNRDRGTSYQKFYTPSSGNTSTDNRKLSSQARATHDFREIILTNRVEAEEVIDGLCSVVDQYGTVSVSDLYEMIGETGEFTDQKWGWTNLRSASVSRVREGYLLDLPKTVFLDNV